MFATHKRSIEDRNKCALILRKFLRAFPPNLGYEIVVTRYEISGYIVPETIHEDAKSDYLKDLSYA